MTPVNPDPLEVWKEALQAATRAIIAGEGDPDQAAAAIIAQHYALVVAENERLRDKLVEIAECCEKGYQGTGVLVALPAKP